MARTYTPRKSKIRGRQAVDAFGTSWLVVDRPPAGTTTEHEDAGWIFGVNRGQQIAWVA
jgi:hypothetical protein